MRDGSEISVNLSYKATQIALIDGFKNQEFAIYWSEAYSKDFWHEEL